MNALLLDSSDKNLTVALAMDGKIDEISYPAWQRQSELMVREIDNLFVRDGFDKKDLDCVVCSRGPGSYTGVRIALSIAKTIVFALRIPLYLASSLEVLKDGDKPSICLMNARAKRSYIRLCNATDFKGQDEIKTNAEVLEFIAKHPDFSVCGDVSYLGISAPTPAISSNLLGCVDQAHLCENPLGARPVYLKDDYEDIRHKISIRRMKSEDVPAVVALEQNCFKHPYEEKDILFELNDNEFARLYVAVHKKEIVGMIDFSITFNSATINQIGVLASHRGKGIGGLLLEQAIKDCEAQEEPVEFLTLEVRESNETAKAFYQKRGFEAVTKKKGYYSDGEDAIYMLRSIYHD